MTYLILAILCSSIIALIFKHTETTNTNRYVITSANYFIAWVTSLFMILYKGLLFNMPNGTSFFEDFSLFSTSPSHVLSPHSSLIW